MDYDDDRYYIANNIRNSQYVLNPNSNYVQKSLVLSNYPATSNRYVSHPKHVSTNSSIDPRQEIGLPRSSIV